MENNRSNLQRHNSSLVEVDKLITTTIRVFDPIVSKTGHKLSGTSQTIEFDIYKNVPIQTGKAKQFITNQLHRGLVHNSRNRMITTNSYDIYI